MMSLMWGFIFCILGCEIFVIILLSMPLPSNQMRGKIVQSYQNLWKSSYQVRTFCRVTMFLIFLLFLDAMRGSFVYDELHKEGSTLAHNDLMIQIQRFRSQRNGYLTGFALFLYVMIWRQMTLISQLYESRKQCKQQEKPADAKKNE